MTDQTDLLTTGDTIPFDYTTLDEDTRTKLYALAVKGRIHLRRTKEEIIAFGDVLLEAKTLLPHGQFKDWIAAEYGVPYTTAYYAMRKARGDEAELEKFDIEFLPEQAVSKQDNPQLRQKPYYQGLSDEAILRCEERWHRIDQSMRSSVTAWFDYLLYLTSIAPKHSKTYHDVYMTLREKFHPYLFISEPDHMRALGIAQSYQNRYDDIPQQLVTELFNVLWSEDCIAVWLKAMEAAQAQPDKEQWEVEHKGQHYLYSFVAAQEVKS